MLKIDDKKQVLPWERSRSRRIVKRCMDLAISIPVLVLFALPMLMIALFIKITSRGPVIFVQKRLGFHGCIFPVFKFRTMIDRAWDQGAGVSITKNDCRITWIGRFLRLLHLDELPQLFNVIKGDMSLVGPRPTLPFHYDYYEQWEMQRLDMPPGVTGWVQAHGATDRDWDERIKLDVWYVQHWSLGLDLKIILQTFVHLIARSLGRRAVLPPNERGWTRGMATDPFVHSGLKDRAAVERKE